MASRLFSFVGGATGHWQVMQMETVLGSPLDQVTCMDIVEGDVTKTGIGWVLRGVTSYERYVNKAEQQSLVAIQPPLGRTAATRAALIPIRKSAAWWELPQDERRAIIEERSHHIYAGLQHLPAVARRLHHGHDLGEPFDFLTWFEYAPDHADQFEELVHQLRATEEWQYVEREIDIRMRLNQK